MPSHKRRSIAIGGIVLLGALAIAAWEQATRGTDGSALPVTRVGARPVAMAADARSGHIFVVNGGDMAHPGSVSMLDATGYTMLRTSAVGVDPAALTLDARLGRVYVINRGPANGDGMSIGTGSVSVLDTTSGRVVQTARLPMPPRALAADTRTGRVFVAGGAWGQPGRLEVLDGASGQVLRTVAIPPNAMKIVVDARTAHAFVVGAGVYPHPGGVTTLDARDGRVLRTVTAGRFPMTAAVDERTGRVFVANGGNSTTDGNVSVLDAASGRVLRTIAPGSSPTTLAVDTRAGRVYVLMINNKSVAVLDARDGASVGAIPVNTYLSNDSMAIDEQRHRAYIADASGTYVIDTESRQARRVPAAKGSVVAVDDTGRAFVADADTAGDDDPKGLAGLIGTLLHGPPSHLGLVGAHSPGKVRALDP